MSSPSTSNSQPPASLHVQVKPPTFSDLPSLAECELLAFSGSGTSLSSSEEKEINFFLHLKAPFRAPLVRKGVHPRYWPDFEATMRRRMGDMRKGALFFAAFVDDDEFDSKGGEGQDMRVEGRGRQRRAVGYVKLMPPRSIRESTRARRKFRERLVADVVQPVVERVRSTVSVLADSGADGVDMLANAAFKRAQDEVMRRNPVVDECYLLHILVVHPSYQRRGVGSTLLKHAITLANSTQHSIFIRDASPQGLPLYLANNFRQIDAVNFSYGGVNVYLPALIRGYGSSGQGQEADEVTITNENKVDDEGNGHESDEYNGDAAVLVSPGMRSNGSEDEYVSVSPGQLN